MRYFLFATLLAVNFLAPTQSRAFDAMSKFNDDATEMVGLLLEAEQLRQYLPEFSDASPLKLVNETMFLVDPEGLVVEAEVVAPGSIDAGTAIVIQDIDYKEPRATLHFRYAPEGLRGSADFQFDEKTSRWTLNSIEVFET